MARSRRPVAGDFMPIPNLPSAGFTLAAHWFRVAVQPRGPAPSEWVLAIGANYLNDVQVWVPGVPGTQGTWVHHQRGDRFTSEIWVRVQTTSVMNVTMDLWQPAAYAASETATSMLYTALVVLLVAVAVAVVVVMGLLGLGMKDRVFLTFAAYLSTLAVLYFCTSGTLQMLWPLRPWWVSDILVGYGALCAFSTANFLWIELLDMRQNFKRMGQALQWSAWALLALTPLMATDLYSIMGSVVYLLSIPLGLCTLYAVSYLWLRCRQALNLLYLLAFSSSTLGTWSILGTLTGLLPRNELTTAAYHVSIALTAMIMTAAMVLRIIRIQHDKHAAEQANELAMLGTPYYRATSAIGHQGTGLGYHFCQQIAQAHGGSMHAHNREGGGLVVVLRLPQ
jgi:two-component system, sensor histidine kinase LadS